MILVLDNYDSFVYNLARYIQVLGFKTEVHRSDRLSVNDIEVMSPEAIIISPGPCTPNEAGISIETIKQFGHRIPILGVCLGHQAIGQAFGASVIKALCPTHGKARWITHDGNGIFEGLESPLMVGRYHSLILGEKDFPSELIITSYSEEKEIMSIQHKTHKIYGVQFHPESLLTEKGYQILYNFLKTTLINSTINDFDHAVSLI